MKKRVLIIGATGNLGLAFRKYFLDETDYYLTLIARHATSLKINADREQAVNVDATNFDDLKKVVANQDVVISALCTYNLPNIAKQTVRTMEETNVKRLIFTSAMGIYNEIPENIDPQDNVENNPLQIPNRNGALIVENSELNYTILRPGYYQSKAGPYELSYKGQPVSGYRTSFESLVEVVADLVENSEVESRESIGINLI